MQIPLHAGGTWVTPGPVVAYAEVDPEDFEELSQYRWNLDPNGYAARTERRPGFSVCPECGWVPKPHVRHPHHSVAGHRARMHAVTAATLPRRHTITMHRQILALKPGNPLQGDHVNRNRIDNRRTNLRVVEAGHQSHNQGALKTYRGQPVDSKHRGVYKIKKRGKWTGRWKVIVAGQYLGCFTSEAEAAEVARAHRLATMPGALD